MVEQLIAIFCDVNDFCKGYEDYCTTHLLMDKDQVVSGITAYSFLPTKPSIGLVRDCGNAVCL